MNDNQVFWTEKGEIKCWQDVRELLSPHQQDSTENRKWIFRGEYLIGELEKLYFPEKADTISHILQKQNERNDYLETHLEKAFKLNGVESDDDKRNRGRELIRTFQRKAALYLDREPDKDDILEWLAIMNHHGAPTRLLDWTYSFYAAVYFALNEHEKGVVWGLDIWTINKPEPIVKRICEQKDGFRMFSKAHLHYLKQCDLLGMQQEGDKLIDLAVACYLVEAYPPLPCIYPVNPFRLNKRLSVQQGLFLMTGDITKPLAENLIATFGSTEETKRHLWRAKIVPQIEERKKILDELKDMNISNEALFPGLDGFARSVGEKLAYPRPLGGT